MSPFKRKLMSRRFAVTLNNFLRELEKETFKIVDSKLVYSNFSKEEWQAMRALADIGSIVIKKADKGSTACLGL